LPKATTMLLMLIQGTGASMLTPPWRSYLVAGWN